MIERRLSEAVSCTLVAVVVTAATSQEPSLPQTTEELVNSLLDSSLQSERNGEAPRTICSAKRSLLAPMFRG